MGRLVRKCIYSADYNMHWHTMILFGFLPINNKTISLRILHGEAKDSFSETPCYAYASGASFLRQTQPK